MTTNSNNGVQTSATPSESTKAPKSIMPKPLQPRVCVQRDENTLVPLIAIDELPDSVVLKGVPLKLTLIEALKAHIELINIEYPAQSARYELDRPISTHVDTTEQGDDSGSDSLPISEGSADSAKKEFMRSKGNKNMKDKALRQPLLTANDNSIIDPLAKKGTMGKKVYCTYWIQTGNCNYMQEGCKYKHEIPKDEETRRAIGFREFPNWPREEMPARPAPAINNKSWRRQDVKSQDTKLELPRAPGISNRGVHSSAAAPGTPKNMARANSQPSAGVSNQAATANAQYHPNVTTSAAPHQHLLTHANHTTQQRPFSQGAQSFLGNGAGENHHQGSSHINVSPPSYGLHPQMMNGGRSGSSTPPKQPPISRPTNLGQSSVGKQQHGTGASTRRVAPDHHMLGRASGLSGSGVPGLNSSPAHITPRPVYSGMHNNWNPHTNGPTSMDISFIAPPESTRSSSQTIYTPNFTSSNASATPTVHNGNAFGSLSDSTKSHSQAGTQPHHHNNNAFANNGNAPTVKGRGPVQYGLTSPTPSTGSAQNGQQQASTTADESDATSVTSPPILHRVFFREPGQPEFVSNGPEPKKDNGKTAHGLKKHGRKAHGTKSAKSKMSGNGYDVLPDVNEQQ